MLHIWGRNRNRLGGELVTTDSQIIREIKDGNTEAYAILVRRYERRIYAFIFHMLKSKGIESMTEDLCQETFYKVYRHIKSFRDVEATFSTWIYTIARNTVLSELRKSKNSDVPIEDSNTVPNVSIDRLPENELIKNEKIDKVREAINLLPDKQRFVLILREYEQMDYREIATLTDTSVSSVKSLLFRARNNVKDYLHSYMSEHDQSDRKRSKTHEM